ncbi:uncharacterized protein LOC131434855 [Malaya genurostris]|uniref:uncharacterized protein LOC131434855 n=1 Tax=Malaya genurostris TaxID=325434 RepID=UPI0026F3D7EA|nr:uncharacterized protein LOC131434855 [Malaya genurostris]
MTDLIQREIISLEDSDVLLICETVPIDGDDSNMDIVSFSSVSDHNIQDIPLINIEIPKNHTENELICDWNVDEYRNAFEPDVHWEMRRSFMVQYKNKIPESELVALAQAFVNTEVFGAVYCEEVTAKLELLGESIAKQYRMFKSKTPKRITARATEAVHDWMKHRSESLKAAERKDQAIQLLGPVFTVTTVEDIFRNYVLLDDNLEESGREFEKLGCGWFVHDVWRNDQKLWEATCTVAGFLLSKAVGPLKKSRQKCTEELLKLFRKKCYKIRVNHNRCWDGYNVERLEVSEDLDMRGNPFDCRLRLPLAAKDQLKEDNVGYRLLRKLGWGGGPLGKHQVGIVDPIEVQAKRGRRGLGLPQLSLRSDGSGLQTPSNNASYLDQLDLSKTSFRIDVGFYRDLMRNFKAKRLGYDLIFSSEFTETERALLTKIATDLDLQCTTITYDYEHYQFVLMKHRVSPHDLLIKIIVENHPIYSTLYTVEPPEDDLERHNKILELCSK